MLVEILVVEALDYASDFSVLFCCVIGFLIGCLAVGIGICSECLRLDFFVVYLGFICFCLRSIIVYVP